MRKPTKKEKQEIIDDMIALHHLDPVKYPLLADRGDSQDTENLSDQELAEFILKDVPIIICENDGDKRGVIFFEWNCMAILAEVGGRICLSKEEWIEHIYWGSE